MPSERSSATAWAPATTAACAAGATVGARTAADVCELNRSDTQANQPELPLPSVPAVPLPAEPLPAAPVPVAPASDRDGAGTGVGTELASAAAAGPLKSYSSPVRDEASHGTCFPAAAP